MGRAQRYKHSSGNRQNSRNPRILEILELPWQCHGNAMAVPWQCHGSAMAMPWQCHGSAMAVPWQCHQVVIKESQGGLRGVSGGDPGVIRGLPGLFPEVKNDEISR